MKKIDEAKIKSAVRQLLEAIGEDPDREGLLETPDRIARMCQEILTGSEEEAIKHLSKTFTIDENNIVVEKDITFYSMCEHHMLPFYGKAHIAYIPDGKVAGLSKLARTVETHSHKLQLQERLNAQIADSIYDNLNCAGVIVVLEAEHMCMTMRGVKKPGAKTITLTSRGIFDEHSDLRKEALKLLGI